MMNGQMKLFFGLLNCSTYCDSVGLSSSPKGLCSFTGGLWRRTRNLRSGVKKKLEQSNLELDASLSRSNIKINFIYNCAI